MWPWSRWPWCPGAGGGEQVPVLFHVRDPSPLVKRQNPVGTTAFRELVKAWHGWQGGDFAWHSPSAWQEGMPSSTPATTSLSSSTLLGGRRHQSQAAGQSLPLPVQTQPGRVSAKMGLPHPSWNAGQRGRCSTQFPCSSIHSPTQRTKGGGGRETT